MKTEIKETGKKEKTAIVEDVEAFLQESGTSLETLKYKVARMSIDITGTMQNTKVLIRARRGTNFSTEYYRNGSDDYNDHDRLWWEFPIHFYRDMPSGEFIRYREEGYYLVDENDKILHKIDKKDLINDLIDDLIERNYEDFNDNWDEFIIELQKWINEVE